MRLGYFGGSFDPPHLGHLAVARAAANSFQLSSILMVPTGQQPLKPSGLEAGYQDRLAMVRLLCEEDSRLTASTLEAPATPPSPNYTVDTLRLILRAQPEADLFVIVGADAFQSLPLWRSPEQLLNLAEWIVVTRPHLTAIAEPGSAKLFPVRYSRPTAFPLPPLTPTQRKRVHLLPTVDHEASATAIRAELAHGGECGGMLSAPVLAYIRKQHLYSSA